LPDDIAPDIGPFNFYLEAFRELSSCRPSGFGIGPIPFTAIVEYSKIYNVEDFDDFLYFIRLMDSKILELEVNKQKKQDGQNGRKSNKGHKS
jgi:hypothetical protein